MKLRSVLCLLIVAGLLSLTLAADDKSASKQAQGVKQNSQAATKAASPEKAKAQSGKGFDTKGSYTPAVKAGPVTKQDPKAVAKRENTAQKERDKATAKKVKLDDPKRAPPSPK